MNRFSKEKKISYYFSKIRLPLIAFIILFILFLRGVSSIDVATVEQQQKSLTTSLQRNITQCYALEGTYPPSLDYLVAHYGLIYDETLLFVDYQFIGANIYPDVTIILKESY